MRCTDSGTRSGFAKQDRKCRGPRKAQMTTKATGCKNWIKIKRENLDETMGLQDLQKNGTGE